MEWLMKNKAITASVICAALIISAVGISITSKGKSGQPKATATVPIRVAETKPGAEDAPKTAPIVQAPVVVTEQPASPVEAVPETTNKTEVTVTQTPEQAAPAPVAPPVGSQTAPSDSDYVAPGNYPKTQEERTQEGIDKVRAGGGVSSLKIDTSQLEADSDRLKNATTRGEIKEHIRVNQELVAILKNRTQTENTQRKIARLEAEIQTDLQRLSG